MLSIMLPPELEDALSRSARAQGTTPERLVLDSLRERFTPDSPSVPEHTDPQTLYDFLQGYAGTVDGTTEALSENTGQRFAEGMAEKHRSGKL